ncbi:MAG TPA: cryptochrome/photolyase family protein [Chitinophagaceae bacterium]|nr:cryptochrome/photolyase family protein [Chitinophagaceae bacterium]
MLQLTLIFPHQLFRNHPALSKENPVCLVEEYLFFSQYQFHKQKLMLHRAAMKAYEAFLRQKGFQVLYVEARQPESDIRQLVPWLHQQGTRHIQYADSSDYWLEKRLSAGCTRLGIRVDRLPTPAFLNTMPEVQDYFDKRKTYFQTDFYTSQRKQRKILLDTAGKPLGGKWTFDAENRKRFPRNEQVPALPALPENPFTREARSYIEKNYPDNYGYTSPFIYPVTFKEADQWLDTFLDQRLLLFGDYEDAMVKDQPFLYHSLLSPLLNCGLLEPQQVLDKVLVKGIESNTPLNALEGFVRQLTGWREFIRIVYEREGTRQRTRNYWGFSRKIPPAFWTGETGIHPVDTVIKRILKYGYAHHIERLMVLGNFMLLCEFDPDEVYRWFMEMFADSYDWVMVPNVYGMTQFADGGLMTTKPYISGSNYLLKMGDWNKGPWQDVWDGLFWRFMEKHRDFFSSNPRLGMLLKTLDKMPAEKRNRHMDNAAQFLQQLDA